jgi:hypothetical protein
MKKKLDKILKKPKVKVESISSNKILKEYSKTDYKFFHREPRNYQPQEHPVQDRSSLFNNEFDREKRRSFL